MSDSWSYLSPGDLVRYVSEPDFPKHNILPSDKNPLGLVITVETVLVGGDPEHQAHMEVVEVIWNIQSWNNDNGFSLECPSDLFLLQKGNN